MINKHSNKKQRERNLYIVSTECVLYKLSPYKHVNKKQREGNLYKVLKRKEKAVCVKREREREKRNLYKLLVRAHLRPICQSPEVYAREGEFFFPIFTFPHLHSLTSLKKIRFSKTLWKRNCAQKILFFRMRTPFILHENHVLFVPHLSLPPPPLSLPSPFTLPPSTGNRIRDVSAANKVVWNQKIVSPSCSARSLIIVFWTKKWYLNTRIVLI
jgi:hypothetical protein